jgi:hypothetical protein
LFAASRSGGKEGGQVSDFDSRPGDEIEPMGEGGADLDSFVGPDVAEQDVVVDDIHERDDAEQGSPGRRGQ